MVEAYESLYVLRKGCGARFGRSW